MEIVKNKEFVRLSDYERCTLEKAMDIICDIYVECENGQLDTITNNILNNLIELLENYITE